jgi:hypothetical protein
MHLRLTITAFVWFWAQSQCSAEPRKPDADTTKRLLIESREALLSGEFKAEGQFVDKWAAEHRWIRKWKIHSVFDSERGLLRLDDRLQRAFNNKLVTVDQKFIRAENRSVHWFESSDSPGGLINIYAAKHDPPDLVTFLDVRAVGLGFDAVFDERQSLEASVALLHRYPMELGEVREDGTLRLDRRWRNEASTDEFYRATWIDPERGHTIQRVEQFAQPPKPDRPSDPAAWGRPGFVADYTWANVNAVWCPISVHIENSATSFELKFDWISANDKVPAVPFTEAGLGVDKLTPVYDCRGARDTLLGTLDEYLKGLPRPKRRGE